MGYTELKYQTFDDLLNQVLVDLRILDEEGMIEPAQLIKIVQRVNYDLGLRINQTKETIIEVNNHVAKLPEDFYVLNFAMLTGHHKEITPNHFSGRVLEQVDIVASSDTCCLTPLTYDINQLNPNKTYCNTKDTCTPEADPWFQRSCFSICGNDNAVKVIQKKGNHIHEYSWFERLYIAPQKDLDPGSMNSKMVGCGTAEIKNGYLYVHSNENCKVYISYQGALEDEQGNLLALSHPEIDFYYYSAITEQIFKNLWYSSGEEVKGKLDDARIETQKARARALSIVNMPNFQEMQKVFRENREAQYSKYYRTFQTGVFNSWFRSKPF